jgi:amino acid transporter
MELKEENNQQLSLNSTTLQFMMECTKWAKFFAVMSFIGLGLMLLVGILFLIIPGKPEFMLIGGFYLVFSVIYYFPGNYLLQFSNKTRNAIDHLDEQDLEEGIKNLKSLFRFTGILTIVVLSLYVLFIIGAIIFGIIMASHLK